MSQPWEKMQRQYTRQVQETDFVRCYDCDGWMYSPQLHKLICPEAKKA